MRVFALALTLVLMGATALAGQSLWQVLRTSPDFADATTVSARIEGLGAADAPMPPRQWPALFGVPEKVEPQPPTPPQPPAPAAPPAPPMDALGYVLQGVVRAGDGKWAIVSHPTGQRILRVGDALEDGITVVAMDEQGLLLERAGTQARLAFPE